MSRGSWRSRNRRRTAAGSPTSRTCCGDRYALFCGVDDLALESVMLGAVGWVSGLVNAFPAENRLLWDLATAGRYDEARRAVSLVHAAAAPRYAPEAGSVHQAGDGGARLRQRRRAGRLDCRSSSRSGRKSCRSFSRRSTRGRPIVAVRSGSLMAEPVLIGGEWRPARHDGSLRAVNPPLASRSGTSFRSALGPIAMRRWQRRVWPRLNWQLYRRMWSATFLDGYADRLAAKSEAICVEANLGDGAAGQATSGRRGDAAHDQSIASGRRPRPVRVRGGWPRSTRPTTFARATGRSGRWPYWAEQLSAGVQRHFGRRLCRRDCRRQSGDRQGASVASADVAAVGPGGARGGDGDWAAGRHGAAPLQDVAAGRRCDW